MRQLKCINELHVIMKTSLYVNYKTSVSCIQQFAWRSCLGLMVGGPSHTYLAIAFVSRHWCPDTLSGVCVPQPTSTTRAFTFAIITATLVNFAPRVGRSTRTERHQSYHHKCSNESYQDIEWLGTGCSHLIILQDVNLFGSCSSRLIFFMC